MPGISILYPSSSLLLPSYELYPLVASAREFNFDFHTSQQSLQSDRNECLLIVGWLQGAKVPAEGDYAWFEQLRRKYRVIAYLDCNDGAEIQRPSFLQFFDYWFMKQVFRDRNVYLRDLPGKRAYTGFYMDRFGVSDESQTPSWSTAVDTSQVEKIRPAWNILIGAYPLHVIRTRLAASALWWRTPSLAAACVATPALRRLPQPKLPRCQARFTDSAYRPTVGFQRRLLLERVRENRRFLTGAVPKRQYQAELQEVQAVLSPFGWGEVCFRDAEAVIAGAVLVKPEMSHVETWPDLYQKYETYVPIEWDGSDVVEQVANVLDAPAERLRIAQAAWERLRAAYHELPRRVRSLRDTMLSGTAGEQRQVDPVAGRCSGPQNAIR